MSKPPTITGYSTALFSTWLLLEEYGVLFDAGDGVGAGLTQKSRKAKFIFISHADRDHLGGLLQLYRLNAREGKPLIYYPKDCGSFPALRQFAERFDPDVGPATWQAISDGDEIPVGNNVLVKARRNEHVVQGDLTKSLDFTVIEERRKLKAELQGRSSDELASLRAEHDEDHISTPQRLPLVGYSADTPRCEASRWQNVRWLIHEATFLNEPDGRGAHCNLPQVIAEASQLKLQALVLTHFSSRYNHGQICSAITRLANQHQPSFDIYAILPGNTVRNLLGSEPIWRPRSAR